MITTMEICDAGQCPAHAKVTVTMPTGDLVLCDHHYRYNYDLLIAHGAETYDAPQWPEDPPDEGNEPPEEFCEPPDRFPYTEDEQIWESATCHACGFYHDKPGCPRWPDGEARR